MPDGVSGGSAAGVGQIWGSCSNPGALYNNNNDNNIIIMIILILVIIIIIIIHACVYLCVLGSPRMVLSCPPETWGRQRALQEHQVLCRDARAQQLGDISNSNTGWGMILNPKDP